MQIEYRIAGQADLEEICSLVSRATDGMIKQNIFQWDELYPVKENFLADIEQKQLYAGVVDNRIAVIYALNRDCDTAYENGNWKQIQLHSNYTIKPDIQKCGMLTGEKDGFI